ncbi:hypothetical protein NIES2100_21300 [Calothrix sp. NIES-2100]|uniref:LamG-like jellyroll fold domain-containing protein n=1 Tax=Calothrix sp. NIES-2100 TaxID=1954172 RepID=UPI000B61FF3F|nr:hypothetical protein NIES2100_21300 [Calothrix sp. NIES-2100]
MTQIKDVVITKTATSNGDYLILQNPETNETYKITVANFLAGLSSGGSGGSSSLGNFIFLAHFDGSSFTDEKGNVISTYGSASLLDTQKKFGTKSANFTGGSDKATANLIIPADSNITIEFWVWLNVVFNSNNQYGYFAELAVADKGITFVHNRSGGATTWAKKWNCLVGDFDSDSYIESVSIPSLEQWHHLCLSRVDGTNRFFIDGALQGSNTNALSIKNPTLALGVSPYNQATYGAYNVSPMQGYIDEFSVSLTTHRTANFTPPTAAWS